MSIFLLQYACLWETFCTYVRMYSPSKNSTPKLRCLLARFEATHDFSRCEFTCP